jgi:HPt (histidine-containing phosphotransfer) domain-containing protein
MRQMMALAAAIDGSVGSESADKEGAPAGCEPVIDLVHLARQTLGDAALEKEILQLFVTQLRSVEDRLAGADGRDTGFLIHGLKGSARSVGAFPLADACAAWEERPGNDAKRTVTGVIGTTKAFAERLIG